jgi:site-specific recombinase XerD
MKRLTTFSILFWINQSRVKNNYVSIYARITVNSKRVNISLQRKVLLCDWDTSSGKVRGTKKESRILNRYIDQVRSRIFEAYEQLNYENKLITAQGIKARFLGEDDKHYSLLTLIDYHNTQMSESLRFGTLKNYFTTQKYIKIFLNENCKTSDIYLSQLTYQFIVDFERFLRLYIPIGFDKSMGHNTVMKHLQRLRKMVSLAYKMEWLDKDPFIKFKPSYKKVEREFLTDVELRVIIEKEFDTERLTSVRDMFVFSCYTGLSYTDVMQLTEDNIVIGIDGNKWIMTKRQKTDTRVRIPILITAEELMMKYIGCAKSLVTDTVFPVISNQKMNVYLKEIAMICGISKNITFHMARHTFATTVTLSNGVPIETVSKLLGHSKIATTQIYARVLEHKVSNDMNKLRVVLKTNQEQNTLKRTN